MTTIPDLPAYKSLNAYLFNAVALEQGVEIGSPAWLKGGPAAFSGQTGAQESYGWSFDHLLSDAWVRAVIANYASRPCWYEDAPVRSGGYHTGGRPAGWKPQEPGDQPNGDKSYFTSTGIVNVSGPDMLHFHLGPLFSIADSHGYTVKALGFPVPAEVVAQVIIRYAMASLAGMVRKDANTLTGYFWGDRGTANLVWSLAQAAKRGLVSDYDAATLWQYVSDVALPVYEKPPGLDINMKDNGLPTPNVQTYNGIYWLVPAFHAANALAPTNLLMTRMHTCLIRWCQYLVDIDAASPALNMNVAAIALKPEMLAGKDGGPLDTLAGLLSTADVLKGQQADLWGYCACQIAGGALAAKMAALPWKVTNESKKWLANA